MRGSEVISALYKKFNVSSEVALAKELGVSQPTINNWGKLSKMTPLQIAGLAHKTKQSGLNGDDIIKSLKSKFNVSTDLALANELGISQPAVNFWRSNGRFTASRVAKLAITAKQAGAKNLQENAIRPIVEFFPINKSNSRQNKNYEIFNGKGGSKPHPYLHGLQNELKDNKGVYIFFDSRGHAIYVGKTNQQDLWKELNLTFNRSRGDLQKIKRVKHPSVKKKYQTTEEKTRQIYAFEVSLHELAAYFSAYKVADSLINIVEAMLVRSFANNLLNKKMENFK